MAVQQQGFEMKLGMLRENLEVYKAKADILLDEIYVQKKKSVTILKVDNKFPVFESKAKLTEKKYDFIVVEVFEMKIDLEKTNNMKKNI